MKKCASRIIEITDGTILDIKGGYDSFIREKAFLEEKEVTHYKEKKRELKKLSTNLEHFQDAAFKSENQIGIAPTDNDKMGFNYMTEKAAKKFARRAEVINRKINDFEELQKPQEDWTMRLELANNDIVKTVYTLEDVSLVYPNKTGIHNFSYVFSTNQKVWLSGINGSGKSTLLKLLYGELTPTKGILIRNETVKVGYLSQDHLEIDTQKTILQDFLDDMGINEPKARTYLHQFLFKDYDVFRDITTFSQGEKAKYAFAKMLYSKPHFLLLDEPTNYMDIVSKDIIEKALQSFTGGYIIATHDRDFVEKLIPDATIHMESFSL